MRLGLATGLILLLGIGEAFSQDYQPVGELLSVFDEVEQSQSIRIKGRFAYVLNDTGILHVFDISGLEEASDFYTNGKPVASFELPGGGALEQVGNFLYVAGNGYFWTYDISDGEEIEFVDAEQVGVRNFINLVLYEDFLLGLGDGGFTLYNISDKENPVYVTEYKSPDPESITYAAAVVAPYLYVSEAATNVEVPEELIVSKLVFDFSAAPEIEQVNRIGENNLALHMFAHEGRLVECGVGYVRTLGLEEPLRPALIDISDANGNVCALSGATLATNGLVFEIVDGKLSPVSEFDQAGDLNAPFPFGSDVTESHFFLSQAFRVYILNNGGKAGTPVAQLSDTALDFGLIPVGESAQNGLTLTNIGDADLVVTAASLSNRESAFRIEGAQLPITVAPQASVTWSIFFEPVAGGVQQVAFSITDNADGSPRTVSVTGEGGLAALVLSTETIDFGNTPVGNTATATLALKNEGNLSLQLDPLTISALDETFTQGFSIVSGGESGVLEPGAERNVTLSFLPESPVAYLADLLIASDATEIPLAVRLQGRGVAPALQLSRTRMDYGDLEVGGRTEETVVITNDGTLALALEIMNIVAVPEVQEGDFASFSLVSGAEGGSLAPGESRSVVIAFSPELPGRHNGRLEIVSSDASSPHYVLLEGSGVMGVLDITPMSLDFGDVRVGETVSQNILLANTGDATLALDAIQLINNQAEAFTILEGSEAGMLAAGATQEVTVAFTPNAKGNAQAQVRIESEALEAPALIGVSGNGIEPGLELSEAILAFPATTVGGIQTIPLQVKNVGDAVLTLSTFVIDPNEASVFSIPAGSDLPVRINPGAEHVLQVAFAPVAEVAYEAVLSLASDAPDSPHTVLLTGTGTRPGLQVSPVSVRFEDTPLNVVTFAEATIENTGSEPVSVTDIRLDGDVSSVFAFAEPVSPGVMEPGATLKMTLQFAPTAPQEYTGMLIVEAEVPESPFEVVLSGRGTLLQVDISPEALAFGDVPVGSVAMNSVGINNTGNLPISVTPSELIEENAAFSITAGGGEALVQPGETHTIELQFAPNMAGAFIAQLQISTSANEAPVLINLTGNAVEGAIVSDQDELVFGRLTLGSSEEQSVTLSNVGTADVLIEEIEIQGMDALAFEIVNGNQAGMLAPGAERALTIQFIPTRFGLHEASLRVRLGAGDLETVLTLTGTGQVTLADPNVEVPEEGEDVTVEVALPEPNTLIENTLYYRRGGEQAYDSTSMEVTEIAVVGSIPNAFITARGIDYYVRMSDGMNEYTFPAENPAQQPMHIQVRVPPRIPPVIHEPGQHRMISIPLLLDNPSASSVFEDDYGAYDQEAWRLHRWEPETEAYVEYNGEETLLPGTAYWLITRDGDAFDVEDALSVPATTPYQLTLQPGWNQISTPYPFVISWENSVSTLDPADLALVEAPVFYDGTDYVYDSNLLQPWTGYFVFNRKGAPVQLAIEPVEVDAGEAGKHEGNRHQHTVADSSLGYSLTLNARLEAFDLRDADNILGFSLASESEASMMNRREAPGFADHLSVRFVDSAGAFAHRFKSITSEGSVWDVEVEAAVASDLFRTDKAVSIAFTERGERPASFDLFVFDLDKGQALPVVDDQIQIMLRAGDPPRRLRLVLGTEAFALTNSEHIPLEPVPDELAQNYPNPFQVRTTIPYQVSARQRVEIEIFNLLGQRIVTLVQEERNAGQYETHWDGRDAARRLVASGVYLYRMRSDAFEATRRLVVIR